MNLGVVMSMKPIALGSGQVADRPWGMTLWELGSHRWTGQLTLRAEGRRYCIVLDHGAVVAATSPLAGDSITRIALTHRLIAPPEAAEVARRIAAEPARDEVEVLAEVASLAADQALLLRRKVIEQRAARTFAIEEGELAMGPNLDIPVVTELELDVRGVIYLGARRYLSEQRLGGDLRRLGLGLALALAPGARGALGSFGFTEAEQPILDALAAGTSLAELEATHRELDPRHARAVIYALACCAMCTGAAPAWQRGEVRQAATLDGFAIAAPRDRRAERPSSLYSRTRTGRDVFAPFVRAARPRLPDLAHGTPPPDEHPSAAPPAAGEDGAPRPSRTSTSPAVPRALLPSGADTVTDRSPVGPPPDDDAEPAPPAADPRAAAQDAFHRAQSRLRVHNLEEAIADLSRAVELAPDELEYATTLAWARFCHATDKQALAQTTRELLARAIRKSPAPEDARYYLGRVERMLGRDQEALRHLQQVLEVQPRHAEAAAELRAVEARMARAAARERGVLDQKR